MKNTKEVNSAIRQSDHMKETQDSVGDTPHKDIKESSLSFDLKELRVAGIHAIIREHKLVFVMKDWNTIDLMEEFQPLGEKLEKELDYSHSDNRNLYFEMMDIIHTRTILRRLEAVRIKQ